MSKQEFIEQIASYVKKYAPSYGIEVYSPIIAQAILESAYGTSELAVNACNFFGLKYRGGRCKTCIGIYNKVGDEQNSDGSYTSSAMKWCKFENMENGVIGYFDFINISNYANLKGVANPREYLENIKADGYATSLNYVDNLMSVIENWSLTDYDKKEENEMSNSSLVNCTVKSPNHSGTRTHAIDRITPHCVVGQLTAVNIGGCFTSSDRQASCNYGIGSDGKVCLVVDECNRSWCSSSNENDQRAVTIECASDKTDPYAFTDTVYNKLVELCVDICKRNGKTKLIWFGDKDKTLNYNPASNEMVLTVHRWFANKSCPGNWMYARMGNLASAVTSKLGSASASTSTLYRVRKTWADSKSQLGAYEILVNAKKKADENPGYSVFDESGNVVYAPANGTETSTGTFTNTSFPSTPFTVQVLVSDLNIREGAGMNYAVTGKYTGKGVFTITEVSNGWGKLKSGAGWIYLENASYVKIGSSVSSETSSSTLPSAFSSYKVKVTASALNIRKGAGTNYATVGSINDKGVYTIVAESDGQGASKWGKLKSGAGWISLDYCTRL